MVKVQSSWISKVGYMRGNMQIKTKSGKSYIYLNVPETVFNEMMQASSFGRFFNNVVKAKYQAVEVSA